MRVAPPGFEEEEFGGALALARPEALPVLREALGAAGSLHAWAGREDGAVALRGRGTAHRVRAGGEAWVVRHYRRGGALAPLLKDRYLRRGARRPVLELWASERARRRGVPTPAVQAVVLYPAGPFYRADIATLAVPEAIDLAEATFGAAPLVGGALVEAWRAAGLLLRHAFVAGVEHRDLNLMNVLLEPGSGGGAPRAWLIDLDRARVADGELPEARVRAIVARFHRSRRKLAAAAGREVPAPALHALEAALRDRPAPEQEPPHRA